MTAPETIVAETPTAARAFSSHQPKWQRFQSTLIIPSTKVGPVVHNKTQDKQQVFPYQRQYSHVYHQRLAVLGPRCWEQIALQVSNDAKLTKVKRVLELREGQPSLVVGTLVVETAIDDKDQYLHPESHRKVSDVLYLEDESGRVALEFSSGHNLFSHQFCTGVVLGVQGTVGTDGIMLVEAVFPPTDPPLASLDDSPKEGSKKPPHLLLLSGLECGGAETSSLPRDLMISFLQGRFGVDKAACVSHVVIAGGLIHPPGKSNDYSSGAAALRDLDAFLVQLAATRVPVDVIPGQHDPTTANWPQRGLHSALLPRSMRYGDRLVTRTPNPYAATHKNQFFIGTDGANVRDLKKRLLQPSDSDGDKMDIDKANDTSLKPVSDLEALRQTLEWSHICPTGPDSVPTVPHAESDPMVLTQWPNVYFCGSSQKFATTTVHRNGSTDHVCRLICLPTFATTGQAVLVNLETLDVELLRFDD